MKPYLIVIPARGGSKGIPRKNIIDVNGVPLIAYSILVGLQALKEGVNGEMVVSTDDPEIARIAREYGANVPFLRPPEISGDEAKSVDFLLHAVDFYEEIGHTFGATLLLQPTSPQRTSDDIWQAIEIYESVGQPSLISAYMEEHLSDRSFYRKRKDIGEPLNPTHNSGARRQEYESLFVRNGAIYITDIDYLKQTQKIICDQPSLYVMPKNRSINIDTVEEVDFFRWCLKSE